MAIEPGANVDSLRRNHLQLMRDVSSDVLILQSTLTGRVFDQTDLEQGMIEAFEGDLKHGCMGRSAPARLERALQLARELDLTMPTLEKIRKNA